MKLYVSEPHERHAGPILVADEDHNDIAEFYHNEHATVGQSYETALALAKALVELSEPPSLDYDALEKNLRVVEENRRARTMIDDEVKSSNHKGDRLEACLRRIIANKDNKNWRKSEIVQEAEHALKSLGNPRIEGWPQEA